MAITRRATRSQAREEGARAKHDAIKGAQRTSHQSKGANGRRKQPVVRGKKQVNPPVRDKVEEAVFESTCGAIHQNVENDEKAQQFWLMKAEPESRLEKGVDVKFSIDDLRSVRAPEAWDGVRNYGARNNMRAMRKGDLAFFYHSNCKTPGIAGVMEIVQEHSVDETAFDPAHPYHDPKSTRDNPKWCVVHVAFKHKFPKVIPLHLLKKHAEPGGALQSMQLLKQSRLSVSKVARVEWAFIMNLATELHGEK